MRRLNVSGTLRVPLANGTRSVPDTLGATGSARAWAGRCYCLLAHCPDSPKGFRNTAQGCRAQRLPWVGKAEYSVNPEGVL
jgi:hypothetical protein